jgi:hypothetical protein
MPPPLGKRRRNRPNTVILCLASPSQASED